MVLPLAIVVAQLVAFSLLADSRGAPLVAIPRMARLDPDLGLILITVTLVSLVWMVVGTISTIALLRRGRSGAPVRTAPGAP